MFQRLDSNQAVPFRGEAHIEIKIPEEKIKNIPTIKLAAEDIHVVLKEYVGKKRHWYQKNSPPMSALEKFHDSLAKNSYLTSAELYELCTIMFLPAGSYKTKTEAAFKELQTKLGDALPAIKSWIRDYRSIPEDFYAMFENPKVALQLEQSLKNAHGSYYRKWCGSVPGVVRNIIYQNTDIALDISEAFVLLNEKKMRQDVACDLIKQNPRDIHNIAIAWAEYQVPLKLCERYPKIITPISEIFRVLIQVLSQESAVKFIEKHAEAKLENKINDMSDAFKSLDKNKLVNATHVELLIENPQKTLELVSIMVLLKKAMLLESSEILNSLYQRAPQLDQNAVDIFKKLYEVRLLTRKNYEAILQNLQASAVILNQLGNSISQEDLDNILGKIKANAGSASIKFFDSRMPVAAEESFLGLNNSFKSF